MTMLTKGLIHIGVLFIWMDTSTFSYSVVSQTKCNELRNIHCCDLSMHTALLCVLDDLLKYNTALFRDLRRRYTSN